MKRLLFIVFILLSVPEFSKSFAVLSHEAVVDACWDQSIVPVLRKRFPDCSDEDIRLAKAYAYGGAIMPDMGFFPFGSIFFTNLVHYCCSGDFTMALIDESQDVNEYAFALGALAHYNADNYGHPIGINLSVPMVYPKDKKKFGDTVTFASDPIDHRRLEFAFDVLQVARGNYERTSYHDFIGFQVSKPVLERAFFKTYGIKLESIFTNLDLAIAAFRVSVKNIFPTLTRAAWQNKKDEIQKLHPEITDQQFQYNLSRKEYKSEWKKTPWRVTVVSAIIKVTPKVFGNSRVLRFQMPTAQSEVLFNNCFDSVVVHYKVTLAQINQGNISLENLDYDTGHSSRQHEYVLADKTYLELLKKLSRDQFANSSARLEEDLLKFYGRPASSDKDEMTLLYKTLKNRKKPG